MADIEYYLTFLTFIQIAVAFDFGLLYLENKSRLYLIQDSWVGFLKAFHKRTLSDASRQLQRWRDGMPEIITAQRDDLKRIKEGFSTKYDRERISQFMPAIGFTSGLFGVFLLVWLPLCQRGWIGQRLDVLAVAMQSVVFSQIIYIIGFACYKTVREAMLGIVISLAWMAFYLFLYKMFGIVWRIDSYDFIFYCCLIVPFIPIFVYIIRLLLLIPERRKKANIIKTETAALKQMLDDRMTE